MSQTVTASQLGNFPNHHPTDSINDAIDAILQSLSCTPDILLASLCKANALISTKSQEYPLQPSIVTKANQFLDSFPEKQLSQSEPISCESLRLVKCLILSVMVPLQRSSGKFNFIRWLVQQACFSSDTRTLIHAREALFLVLPQFCNYVIIGLWESHQQQSPEMGQKKKEIVGKLLANPSPKTSLVTCLLLFQLVRCARKCEMEFLFVDSIPAVESFLGVQRQQGSTKDLLKRQLDDFDRTVAEYFECKSRIRDFYLGRFGVPLSDREERLVGEYSDSFLQQATKFLQSKSENSLREWISFLKKGVSPNALEHQLQEAVEVKEKITQSLDVVCEKNAALEKKLKDLEGEVVALKEEKARRSLEKVTITGESSPSPMSVPKISPLLPKIPLPPLSIPKPPLVSIPPPPPPPGSAGIPRPPPVGASAIPKPPSGGVPLPPSLRIPQSPGGGSAPNTAGPQPASTPLFSPTVAVKQLFWNKIDRSKVSNSIWNQPEILSPTINEQRVDQLQRLFAKDAQSGSRSAGVVSPALVKSATPALISVLDSGRSKNVAIMLSKFRGIPYAEIVNRLGNSCGASLSVEQLSLMHLYVPSGEEIQAVDAYRETPTLLGEAERFFLAIGSVPNYREKVDCALWLQKHVADIAELEKDRNLIYLAGSVLKDSQQVRDLLGTVLAIGNFLNATTFRGNAAGFKIDALDALKDVRAADGKTTMLEYVAYVASAPIPALQSQLEAVERGQRTNYASFTENAGAFFAEWEALQKSTAELSKSGDAFFESALCALQERTQLIEGFRSSCKETESVIRGLCQLYCEESVEVIFECFASFLKRIIDASGEKNLQRIQKALAPSQ